MSSVPDGTSADTTTRGSSRNPAGTDKGGTADRGTATGFRSAAHRAYDYCTPEDKNVHGPERAGRVVIGTAIGAFGILGVVAAEQPILGTTMTILLLVMTGYLLATAKTQKCPVKHVATKQLPK